MEERRQNVRVRPDHDLPVGLAIAGDVDVPLDVLDASIGGFGFLYRDSLELEVGRDVQVRVTLPRMDAFTTTAKVRHIRSGSGSDRAGIHLPELDEDQTRALRRYVAELFERGLRVT